MNKIKGNRHIVDREKPEKITKYKIIDVGAAHLSKVQKKKEYDYTYVIIVEKKSR